MDTNHASPKWYQAEHWGLARKLTVAMTVGSLLSLALLVTAVNYASSQELEKQVRERLVSQARLEGQHIGSLFAAQIDLNTAAVATDPLILEMLRQQNQSYVGDAGSIESILLDQDGHWRDASETGRELIEQTINNPVADKLRLFIDYYPAYVELFITDRYGAEIAGSGQTSDYYQADEGWWQAGWNNSEGAIFFSEPELDESAGVVAIDIVIPIVDPENGEVLGVLKSVYDITALISEVGAFALGDTGQAALIDTQGRFVAAQHLDDVGQPAPDRLLLDGRIFTGSGAVLDAVNINGEPVVVGYAPVTSDGLVREIDQLGWVVRSEQANAEAFAPILQLRTTALIFTILAAVAAAGVALWLGRRMTRELGHLAQVAAQLGAGDLDARARASSRDEIGQLALRFNGMADAIQNRDRELSELNQALEARFAEAETAREEAEKANQVKSAFLASMSHELRTPLNSVINFTKFILRGVMGPINERQTEALTNVVESADHLLNLINDVLDMSKIESGTLNLFVEEDVNAGEILATVASIAESLLDDKPVELHQEIEPGLPMLTGDRQRIFQVMLNIVSNACKFTQEGHITIRVRQSNGIIHFAVEDTGPGIASEDQDMIFEAFKQTETGLRQGGGTGLGMPISRNLAEAHGGQLWLESIPGQGTTVYFDLPIRSEILADLVA